MLPEFVQHKLGNASIWLNRSFSDPAFVARLADADGFFLDPACQIVKDQRKIKIGRLTVAIAGVDRSLYVKRYNAFSLRYKIASPFTCSGALRALRGAAILRQANIATAPPVAAVEHRVGRVLTKSFFISQEIDGGKTVDAYWCQELESLSGQDGIERRRAFLAGLAQLFRALHARRIYHNDLKDANILVVTSPLETSLCFFLLDVEGVKPYAHLSDRRRIKNLVQLHRTLGRHLQRTGKLFFLKVYLGPSFADRKLKRKVIKSVSRESSRLDFLKAQRGSNVAVQSHLGSAG